MNDKDAYKVSIITIIINILLFSIKLIAGIISNSKAIISDGFHSLSDVITIIIVTIGIKLSSHKEDEKHQYGHERMECIVAIILSGVLFTIGIGIGMDGLNQIISKSYTNTKIVGNIAVFAAIISILSKEGLFWYTRGIAKKIKSNSLMAEAWHHRTDVMASISSLVGVIFAKLGYPIVDSIASIIICLFVLKTSISIFLDSTNGLIDKSCNQEITDKVKQIILTTNDVLNISKIKSRMFGSKIYLEIEISIDSKTNIKEANILEKEIKEKLIDSIEDIKDCTIKSKSLDT